MSAATDNYGGYQSAIQYYENLKNKMLNQVSVSAKGKLLEKDLISLQEKKDILDKNILLESSKDAYHSNKASTEFLSSAEAIAETALSVLTKKNKSALNKKYKDLKQLSGITREKTDKTKMKMRELLKQERQEIYSLLNINLSTVLNEFLVDFAQKGYSTKEIETLLNSYIDRIIFSKMTNTSYLSPSQFYYARIMAGYYREIAEYNALAKVLQVVENKTTVTHFGGANTDIDILISTLNESNIKNILNNQISYTQEILSMDQSDVLLLQKLSNANINIFGEQVKSWSLATDASSNSVKSVGHRSQLLKSFNSERNMPNHFYLEGNMEFMSRFKNILTALGPFNVLFSTGKERFWMHDFITSFRDLNYFLLLRYKDGKHTDEVILDQPYTLKRQQLRRRYKNLTK